MIELYYYSLILSLMLLIVGGATYTFLHRKYRVVREDKTTSEAVVDIISHVPETGAGPGPHILAGISFVCGFSLLMATIISDIVAPKGEFIAYLVSFSSLAIAALFSTISMWTLWQARRLEFQAGYKIHDFYHLITSLNKDLEVLLFSLRESYQLKVQPFHRVYLITTQPFLGMLSYPNSEASNKFKGLLKQCVDVCYDTVLDYNLGNAKSVFEFHIICGDQDLFEKFHTSFYDHSGVDEKKIKSIILEVENEIEALNDKVNRGNSKNLIKSNLGPFHRVKAVPSVQFMIIGNKLYEFTLEAGNSHSEIFNTQVVHDSRYCEAYIKNFDIFLNHLK